MSKTKCYHHALSGLPPQPAAVNAPSVNIKSQNRPVRMGRIITNSASTGDYI